MADRSRGEGRYGTVLGLVAGAAFALTIGLGSTSAQLVPSIQGRDAGADERESRTGPAPYHPEAG